MGQSQLLQNNRHFETSEAGSPTRFHEGDLIRLILEKTRPNTTVSYEYEPTSTPNTTREPKNPDILGGPDLKHRKGPIARTCPQTLPCTSAAGAVAQYAKHTSHKASADDQPDPGFCFNGEADTDHSQNRGHLARDAS